MVATETPRSVVKRLARGSGLSILIKIANAVLAYAMFLIIARVSSGEDYGIFGVAFSIAVSVSLIAALGQPRAITRYWPQWTVQDQVVKARALLRISIILTTVGMGIAAVLFLAGGALNLITAMPWSFGVAAGTAIFTMAFGWSEYASAALRAQGHIVAAMAPRDVAWRVLVCAIFGTAALTGKAFSAETLILTVGVTLLVVISPQMLVLWRTQRGARVKDLATEERKRVARYCTIMWAAGAADLAKNYAGVVIVSGFFGAETAGGYFASDRTANILSFLLLAVTLVAGPQISRYYHSGRKDLVQLVVGLSGMAAGLVACAGLIFFFLFGAKILSLFNPAYASFLPALLALCFGQLFAAASGPVGVLLVMSGHERTILVLVVCVGVVSVTLQAIGGHYWGVLGVASAAAGGTIFLSVFSAVYAWRKLRIDSTGLSLVLKGIAKIPRLVARALRSAN